MELLDVLQQSLMQLAWRVNLTTIPAWWRGHDKPNSIGCISSDQAVTWKGVSRHRLLGQEPWYVLERASNEWIGQTSELLGCASTSGLDDSSGQPEQVCFLVCSNVPRRLLLHKASMSTCNLSQKNIIHEQSPETTTSKTIRSGVIAACRLFYHQA